MGNYLTLLLHPQMDRTQSEIFRENTLETRNFVLLREIIMYLKQKRAQNEKLILLTDHPD